MPVRKMTAEERAARDRSVQENRRVGLSMLEKHFGGGNVGSEDMPEPLRQFVVVQRSTDGTAWYAGADDMHTALGVAEDVMKDNLVNADASGIWMPWIIADLDEGDFVEVAWEATEAAGGSLLVEFGDEPDHL